ncbi:MAG: hypothetical protein EP307_06735 [Rhodobacteraceae bacterium]|nr:MAG: hypothetical protein EP307_06735 [Paracoccaceae bacterium]
MRRLASALCVMMALAPPAGAQVDLSIPQVRALAQQALDAGDTATAIRAARGLLQADPRDPFAYFILSGAHARQGDIALSRKAAAYAFRYSDDPRSKVVAGQHAARMALAEERFGLAQIWLRRTAIHATSPAEKDLIARDYGGLRRLNPFSLSFSTALRPSSNVNNGSEDSLQVIDGVPVTGILSGTAQALSGVIATGDLTLGYRLARTETSQTGIGLRLYARHVALSSSAQAQAPGARNSDFASHFAEATLRHVRAAGDGALGLTGAAGQSWYAGSSTYRFARGGIDYRHPLGDGAVLSLALSVEERFSTSGTRFDATSATLGATLAQDLANGDRLTLSFGLRDTDAAFANDISTAISARAGYAFGRAFGPVTLDAALTLGHSDYPSYMSGFIVVPGGRQDRAAYADLNMVFQDLDYAGFVPSLQLRTGGTWSNDSRFETREISVSFGIQSRF